MNNKHINNFENVFNNLDINMHIKYIDKVYNKCLYDKQNIVLIGMPSYGKTTIAKLLSKRLNKECIDIDDEIEKKINMKIEKFIIDYGEYKFVEIEKEIIEKLSIKNGIIIATGGGAVLDDENVVNLKYNGKLFFINRSLNKLIPTSDRPLTYDYEKLKIKYYERLPVYKSVADVLIDGDLELDDKINMIYECFY